MNFPWNLLSILSILLHVQKISADDYVTFRNKSSAPLALVEEYDKSKLEKVKLAIPHRYRKRKDLAEYSIKSIYENGPIELFQTACPASSTNQLEKEKKWRKTANVSEESKLFFYETYTNSRMECQTHGRPGPSIKKTNEECGNSQGQIYEVGYPVHSQNGEDIQLMAVYEICYSKVKKKGIIYTKHRIVSPSLLLLKIHEKYEPKVYMLFTSSLDEKLTKLDALSNVEYIYQLVPKYDMPTVLWQNTTLFPFNYTSIGEYDETFVFMTKYDYVVRQFSKMTGKPLTIHSGTYRTTITEDCTTCFGTGKKSVQINSLWRVIMDDENNATILITQHTKKVCGEETSYMCNKDRKTLKYHTVGGCTYTCSLDNDVIELLRLSSLRESDIAGKLDIKYPRTVATKSESTSLDATGQPDANAQPLSTHVDISDFDRGDDFVAALMLADFAAVTALQTDSAIVSNDGNGNSDGNGDGAADGHHGGDHDGGDHDGGNHDGGTATGEGGDGGAGA